MGVDPGVLRTSHASRIQVVNVMAKRTTRTATAGTSETTNNPVAYAAGSANVVDRAADRGGLATRTGNDATRNDSMASEPSEEEIRMRAYRRYLERGGSDGQDFDDWLEAERELKYSR